MENSASTGERVGRFRRVVATIAIVGTATVGAIAVPSAAQAAQFTAKTLDVVNVRNGPGTGHKVLKTLKKNVKVGINCWSTGTTLSGPYGKSNIWYQVDGVKGGWITDAWIYTGKNAAVTKKCSTPPTPPKPPKPPVTPAKPTSFGAKVDAFVKKHSGKKVDFDGSYGAQCADLFSFYNRDVVKAPHVRGHAFQLYDNASSKKYKKLSASTTPQKGDVAIWKGTGASNPGHVGIVLRVVKKGQIEILDQNANGKEWNPAGSRKGSAVKKSTMSTTNLRGYLRPLS